MNTYIALLRGINVGGNCTLPMKELVAILEGLGATKVRTYIQSGNVVFDIAKLNPTQFSRQLSTEIHQRRGFDPKVHILTVGALDQAIVENPFPDAVTDPGSLHVGFLASAPGSPDLNALSRLEKESERFHLSESVFYLHAPEGVGRSKLAANAEKLLGVSMTDRNWNTVIKVRELARDGANELVKKNHLNCE